MHMTTIVGNPKARSKTYTFAFEASQAITQYVEQLTDEEITHHVIDLADYGVGLVQWDQEVINTLIEQINASTYIVIASPTYKATYTGLLKLMLDLLPMNALQGKLVFPLMVGAGYQHHLAVELHMKPVLAELGAITTSRGLYMLDSQLDECQPIMVDWVEQNSFVVKSLL
ncbi:MAG: NAD(P)H-dependent oxidoreductase [Candidatus Pristimantibacillus lignocellulolyticus]|uniref:NAD(P)H-dependent oxidoreductase n=1 Tax=Candidatus Pristimantibacillus lignocellulolyticus TaxID=2994561 RepID=A0A9J6ZHW7_9BACL|nr:MAG: NAD(P)H-dependent oxidoreductase [Candidatus Pristimantibacillus lignocellulolyticus]